MGPRQPVTVAREGGTWGRGALALVIFFAAGCRTTPPAAKPYSGPTDSLAQVAAAINQNNQKIPTLWATHSYEASIVDDKHKSHFVNGAGVLLYRQPGLMRLVGQKEFVGTVFEMGSTTQEFWLKVVPEVDSLWWGRYADLANVDPSRFDIPIRPDLVMAVLAISTINTNFLEPPFPTMRFNPDMDVYMFTWNARLPDRWVAQKEVWYDRQTKHPRFVFLFDANGRVVLRAALSLYKRIEVPDVPEAERPEVATDYKLLFPDNGSKMEFTLDEVRLENKGIPGPRSIRLPDLENAGVSHIYRIGGGGGGRGGAGE